MVAQLWEYAETHWIVNLKRWIICKLYLSKAALPSSNKKILPLKLHLSLTLDTPSLDFIDDPVIDYN